MAKNEIQRLQSEAGIIDFIPSSDRVILRPIDAEAFLKTKLHLPGAKSQSLSSIYKEMPLQGIVVATGAGFMTDSGNMRTTEVNVGDHVAIDANAMIADFLFDGDLYYQVRASSIIGHYGPSSENRFDQYEMKFSKPTNNLN